MDTLCCPSFALESLPWTRSTTLGLVRPFVLLRRPCESVLQFATIRSGIGTLLPTTSPRYDQDSDTKKGRLLQLRTRWTYWTLVPYQEGQHMDNRKHRHERQERDAPTLFQGLMQRLLQDFNMSIHGRVIESIRVV